MRCAVVDFVELDSGTDGIYLAWRQVASAERVPVAPGARFGQGDVLRVFLY